MFREVTVAHVKAEERAKEITLQAWQTARFYLQGRSKAGLPSLKKALEEVGKKGMPIGPPQSALGALAALQIIAAQHGLKMRPRMPVKIHG